MEFITVPGVQVTPGELHHPCARELALAIEKRRWFKLIECRHWEPSQSENDDEEVDTVVRPYPAMSDQEIEAIANKFEESRRRKLEQSEVPQDRAVQDAAASSAWQDYKGEHFGEFVIFEVRPDVPQDTTYDIELTERLAVFFTYNAGAIEFNNRAPLTIPLRCDFPIVSHLNARSKDSKSPLSLCLWEESPDEIELKWTAELHLDSVWQWLARTSRGELHAPEQPLEPLLFATNCYLFVPPSLIKLLPETVARCETGGTVGVAPSLIKLLPETEETKPSFETDANFRGRMVKTDGTYTFVADHNAFVGPQVPFTAINLRAEPQTHGVIKHPPRTLAELQSYGAEVGLDVVGSVREQLRQWVSKPEYWSTWIVIVLVLPSRRNDDSAPEKHEIYAFTPLRNAMALGVLLGVWSETKPPVLLVGQDSAAGQSLPLTSLNVAPLLERETAQLFNAQTPLPAQPKIVAIGAGAIGSQIFMNLARAGWGGWTLVDGDLFLPHNGARHALDAADLGCNKAQACCDKANSLLGSSFGATPINAKFSGREAPDSPLSQVLQASDIVFDFSASVPTARMLADAPNSCSRRISVFLNPVGNQMLILAEDKARTSTLTDLEMQLWRAIVTDKKWSDYYVGLAGESVRYARSCGDTSARVPQDFVALHSATASRALRVLTQHDEAALMRWSVDAKTGEVERTVWPLVPMQEWRIGSWKVRASQDVMDELWQMRTSRLPLETGGILLGIFDRKRKIAHLVAALPAPPDSQECHDSFLRGCEGLRAAKEYAEKISGGTVSYLGEWHSHPNGYSASPSQKDNNNFRYLKAYREEDGLPPIMLILADKSECGWFVDEMVLPDKSLLS